MAEAETEAKTESKNIVTVEEAGPCKKKIIVEVPQESIKAALDGKYGDLHKDAVVPGFRKGRAPRRLLEKRFGKEINEEVKLKLIADASKAAIKDNELDTLTDPDVDYESLELPETGPLKFDFEVEVRPEFELPELEGIAIEKPKLEITDEQISEQIVRLQKEAGTWVPQEGAAIQADDQIVADVVIKAEEIEEERFENAEVHVRSLGLVGGVPIKKLDELLAGAKSGDVKKISVDVPETYYNEKYRGRKVDVEIEVKDIKRLEPAEMNDAFLSRLGVEDEAELREKVHESLERYIEQQVEAGMTNQIYKYLLDNIDFDLPAAVVADQSVRVLQRQCSNLLMRGLTREQIEEQTEQLRAGSESQAREQVKLFFIMDKIGGKLGIKVSEEEVNGYIARLAIQRGRRPERMRQEMARDGSLANFTLQIREEKCIKKLLESAKITEGQTDKKAKKKQRVPKKSIRAAIKAATAGKKKTSPSKKTVAKK